MKIIFFGASKLGFKCCEAIINAGHEVVGIFTIPREFNISYSPDKPVINYLFEDFYKIGESFNIPVFEVNQNIKSYYDIIKDLKPDFILAIGWYYIIPKSILLLADKGAAGIHASLLPKGRGNAPLVWALIEGQSETGVSFFFFSEGVDNGDLIAQKVIPIDQEETIKTLLDKVENASIEILLENLPKIKNCSITPISQDHSKATYYPKRSPEDGLINWNDPPEKIMRFIRAQTKPYPGAFTVIGDKKVIIWDATVKYNGNENL